MTLVQNRLLLLSGNKRLLFVAIGLLLAACSPKLRPMVTLPKPVDTAAVIKKPVEVKVVPPPPPPATVISLLLPFQLDQLDLSRGAGHAGIAKADVAMEYYQGFKLALDSLTVGNHNFKLQVFDTKDEGAQAHNLAINTKIRTGNLIIGPVYPEGIKSFSQASPNLKKMVVSPLSPASPIEYKNPNLVTVIPPLEYHCWHMAEYIQTRLKAKKVFILKSGYSDDNKYSIPFKKAIDSLSKKRVKVIELTVVRGNLSALVPQLSATEQNIFIIPATDQQFLQVTLHALDLLAKQHFPVTLFGHPNWEDADYLKADVLQRLNTYISSGDRVNYKSAAVMKFIKEYRKAYHSEPGEYAIKGYDEGLYFGRMSITPGQTIANTPDFEGLHNTFHFIKTPTSGYVNTHVKLYKYTNFELKPVE
ncbi:MAG: ABC transporter substrate-binding protein [Bacteroidota bacterium]